MTNESDPILSIIQDTASEVDPLTADAVEGTEEIVDQVVDSEGIRLDQFGCAAHCFLTPEQRLAAIANGANSGYAHRDIEVDPEVVKQIEEVRREYLLSQAKANK